MDWRIEFTRQAEKDLSHINKPDAQRILNYLEGLMELDNPRLRGKGLTSNLSGLWRYRVDSWRVLCKIEDGRMLVLVVQSGHRSTIYDQIAVKKS